MRRRRAGGAIRSSRWASHSASAACTCTSSADQVDQRERTHRPAGARPQRAVDVLRAPRPSRRASRTASLSMGISSRLTRNPGVSAHGTASLPSPAANASAVANASSSTSGGAHDLHQRHQRRRVEEVQPDDAPGPAARGGDRGDRERRGVGREHRVGAAQPVRASREQRRLGRRLLDDRLDHEVGAGAAASSSRRRVSRARAPRRPPRRPARPSRPARARPRLDALAAHASSAAASTSRATTRWPASRQHLGDARAHRPEPHDAYGPTARHDLLLAHVQRGRIVGRRRAAARLRPEPASRAFLYWRAWPACAIASARRRVRSGPRALDGSPGATSRRPCRPRRRPSSCRAPRRRRGAWAADAARRGTAARPTTASAIALRRERRTLAERYDSCSATSAALAIEMARQANYNYPLLRAALRRGAAHRAARRGDRRRLESRDRAPPAGARAPRVPQPAAGDARRRTRCRRATTACPRCAAPCRSRRTSAAWCGRHGAAVTRARATPPSRPRHAARSRAVPACLSLHRPGQTYCLECGAPLAEPASPPPDLTRRGASLTPGPAGSRSRWPCCC